MTILEQLRINLEAWDFPLGPFQTLEEVEQVMEQQIRLIGASNATEFVKAIVVLEAEKFPHLGIINEVVEMYAKLYPKELEEALFQEIHSQGSPLIVELMGVIRNKKVVSQLKEKLDLESASEELLISLISTLGEIGGNEAVQILHSLQRRKLSQAVFDELKISLEAASYQD